MVAHWTEGGSMNCQDIFIWVWNTNSIYISRRLFLQLMVTANAQNNMMDLLGQKLLILTQLDMV